MRVREGRDGESWWGGTGIACIRSLGCKGLAKQSRQGAEVQQTGQEAGPTEARIGQDSQSPRTTGSQDRVSSKGTEWTDLLLKKTT